LLKNMRDIHNRQSNCRVAGVLQLLESVDIIRKEVGQQITQKRKAELARLFASATAGLVYVTAFPSRLMMARYLGELAWETEVWVAEAPSHPIHFNGPRFLGPYSEKSAV
jgi:hypothetical protein